MHNKVDRQAGICVRTGGQAGGQIQILGILPSIPSFLYGGWNNKII